MTDEVLVYELPIAIRWGDMDAMGHVNNTVYFRYMEQCRISWFESIGVAPDPAGEGPVLVSASCEFRRELAYPGTVLVRQWVGTFGTSSVQTRLSMARSDDPATVCAEGAARIVWVDFPRRKSAPLPADVRERMRTRWGGPV